MSRENEADKVTKMIETLPTHIKYLKAGWETGELGHFKQNVIAIRRTLDLAEKVIKEQLWRNL